VSSCDSCSSSLLGLAWKPVVRIVWSLLGLDWKPVVLRIFLVAVDSPFSRRYRRRASTSGRAVSSRSPSSACSSAPWSRIDGRAPDRRNSRPTGRRALQLLMRGCHNKRPFASPNAER
jgi:hypothetical protein